MNQGGRAALAALAITVVGAGTASALLASSRSTGPTSNHATSDTRATLPPADHDPQGHAPHSTAEAPTTTPSDLTPTAVPDPTVVELAAGTREIATVRSALSDVVVLRDPPHGWDQTLSPRVRPLDAEPARSALDVGRIALPSAAVVVPGRRALANGWALANPGRYRPPQPLRLGVVERQGPWVEVRLPVRPNGTTGWIEESKVHLSSTPVSVHIFLGERTARVLDGSDVVFSAPIAVGRSATPTPTGTFSVTDLVPSIDPEGPYGPVALALDGYSEVMDRFGGQSAAGSPDDEAPVLAVHGTNQPASIGQDASNGCPRLRNEDIVTLAGLAAAGTPVHIWP